jgi:hypothetical protein
MNNKVHILVQQSGSRVDKQGSIRNMHRDYALCISIQKGSRAHSVSYPMTAEVSDFMSKVTEPWT